MCVIVLVLIFGHVTGDDLLFKNKKNLVVQSYVTMDESNINALTGGQIKDVLVEEGDLVTKGQELVRLDSDTLMAQREQAQAALAQAQAAYQSLLNGATEEQMKQLQLAVQIAQANLENAQAAYTRMDADYQRTLALVPAGAVSQSSVDAQKAALASAKQPWTARAPIWRFPRASFPKPKTEQRRNRLPRPRPEWTRPRRP